MYEGYKHKNNAEVQLLRGQTGPKHVTDSFINKCELAFEEDSPLYY